MGEWTKDNAFKFLITYLRSKYYGNVTILERNRFGHALIKTDKGNFYWLYKHDQFHSFDHEFKSYTSSKNSIRGLGESINVEYLQKAMKTKSNLLFSYRKIPNAIYTPSRQNLIALIQTAYPFSDLDNSPTSALLKIFCDHR